jgi:hypothetical protein
MEIKTSAPTLVACDDETGEYLIIATLDLPKPYSFRDLRGAYYRLLHCVDDMRIEYINRDWSPTGQKYTAGLKVVYKQLHYGTLTFVISHTITIDC